LDEFLKPMTGEPGALEERRYQWHLAACAVFKRMFTMAFQQGEWLHDPKPSNFMMVEFKGNDSHLESSLFDVGETDRISLFEKIDPILDAVFTDLIGPTGQAFKGVEELYPELRGVGQTEAAIAMDDVFHGNTYLIAKFLKANPAFSSKLFRHLKERMGFLKDYADLAAMERILKVFPPELQKSRSYQPLMEAIRQQIEQIGLRSGTRSARDSLARQPQRLAA
jgi:hypothetical protein